MRVFKRSIHLYSALALSATLLVAGCLDLKVPPKPAADGGAGKGGAGGASGNGGSDSEATEGGDGTSDADGGKDSGPFGGTGGNGGAGGTEDDGLSDAATDDLDASHGDSGGISPNAYTINGDGTVTDQTTGLTWVRCAAGLSGGDCSEGSASTYSQQEAIDYCDSVDFAGHDDWRLPEIHELVSIVDYTKFDPAIDAITFPAIPDNGFSDNNVWSSSSYASNVSTAWNVNFNPGYVGNNDKSNTYFVRCVRGGL